MTIRDKAAVVNFQILIYDLITTEFIIRLESLLDFC